MFLSFQGPQHHNDLHGYPAQHWPGHSLRTHFVMRHCPPPQVINMMTKPVDTVKINHTNSRFPLKHKCCCLLSCRSPAVLERDGLPPLQLGPEIEETAEETKEPHADSCISSQGFCWCDCVRLCEAPLFPEVWRNWRTLNDWNDSVHLNMMMFVCYKSGLDGGGCS